MASPSSTGQVEASSLRSFPLLQVENWQPGDLEVSRKVWAPLAAMPFGGWGMFMSFVYKMKGVELCSQGSGPQTPSDLLAFQQRARGSEKA